MKAHVFVIGGVIAATLGLAPAVARPRQPSAAPTTASAEVMQCAQAQMVVDNLLAAADTRVEAARQTNSAVEMRAAVEAMQNTLRDVRAQLAPCASLQPPADPHLGHAAPAPPATPATPGDTAAFAEATAPKGATKPRPPITPTAAPTATPPAAADPHAGHGTAPAAKAPASARKPTPKPKPVAKPPAADPHAGHTMAPAKPAPATKGAASLANEPAGAVDPVCGLNVDPKTAPNVQHQGHTSHFCSDQHRELFLKNPAKYLAGQK